MPKPTPTTPTDAARLAAAGTPLALVDGGEVRVRFSFATLLAVENHYGNLGAFLDVIRGISVAMRDSTAAWVGPLAEMLGVLFPDRTVEDFADEPDVIAARIIYAWVEGTPQPDPKESGEATETAAS